MTEDNNLWVVMTGFRFFSFYIAIIFYSGQQLDTIQTHTVWYINMPNQARIGRPKNNSCTIFCFNKHELPKEEKKIHFISFQEYIAHLMTNSIAKQILIQFWQKGQRPDTFCGRQLSQNHLFKHPDAHGRLALGEKIPDISSTGY